MITSSRRSTHEPKRVTKKTKLTGGLKKGSEGTRDTAYQ